MVYTSGTAVCHGQDGELPRNREPTGLLGGCCCCCTALSAVAACLTVDVCCAGCLFKVVS